VAAVNAGLGSSRRIPCEPLERLRATRPRPGLRARGEARRQIVLARIAELTSETCGALADHADGNTFRSLFKDEPDR
jgi:hypothetical protein